MRLQIASSAQVQPPDHEQALSDQAPSKPDQIKYAPKSAEGLTYASGSWVIAEKQAPIRKPQQGANIPALPQTGEKRIATALASPGLFGTWPMVDFCRGYAYIVFVKNLLGEERAEIHKQLKKIVDEQIPAVCR